MCSTTGIGSGTSILAGRAAIQRAECEFALREPKLPERGSSPLNSAVRIPHREEFRIRIFRTSELWCGARHGSQLLPRSELQLQRWASHKPANQCQPNPRRSAVEELAERCSCSRDHTEH